MADMVVNIDVDDLARAERFYTSAFGLEVAGRHGTQTVHLQGAGVPLYLLHKPAGTAPFPGAAAQRAYERHWTPVHLDFVVPDVDAALAQAEAAGATRQGDVETHPWGRIVYVADPFGHGICLLQFPA